MLCASNLKANKLNCRGGEVKEFYNGGAFEIYLHVGFCRATTARATKRYTSLWITTTKTTSNGRLDIYLLYEWMKEFWFNFFVLFLNKVFCYYYLHSFPEHELDGKF